MHDERPVDRILGQRWEEYARRRLALTGQGHPGRDTVVELFGEPDPFEVVVAPFDDRVAGHRGPGRTDPDRPRPAGRRDARRPGPRGARQG
ncbi:hypothetical protein [Kitasatospora sp. MBT63]|uniref:hypothetical protein n=1 Tax=Kitasatospora sp. MBT63 TaxID=1444768 RepID=UPI000691A730|nr:hypothetical protein [Kitasatospora sp. MBT63]